MRSTALFVAALLAACSGAKPKVEAPPALPAQPAVLAHQAQGGQKIPGRRLMVVGINDTHGALLPVAPPKYLASATKQEIGGADWFGGWMNAVRQSYRVNGNEVVILDAGDEFQGTLISNQFQGKSVVEAYNLIGVTASAVGNHEFDFGMPALRERMAQANYPILAANIFKKGTRERPDWARASVIVDQGGIKIGIIGLATIDTPLTTNTKNIEGLEFAPGGPVAAAEADALRAKGATIVLITAHAGPFPPDHEIQQIAEACRGKVDGIVSGHHHTAIKPPLIVANIPIVQSGSKLQNFSTIELTLDGSNHTVEYAVNDGATPVDQAPQAILHTLNGLPAQFRGVPVKPDPRITSMLEGYDVQVKPLRDSRVGETTVGLRKGDKDELLANLTSDALRSGAGGGLKANFAFQNSGGLRVLEIPKGPISFGEIFDLYPFENQQIIVSLSAQEVRNALESVLHAGRGQLRVSGLRYTIEWGKYEAAKSPKDAPWGSLVTEVVDEGTGKLLCETKSCGPAECTSICEPGIFTVAVTDFLANGGDGLEMLKKAPKKFGSLNARDIIVAFVKEHQPLTPELLGSVTRGAKPRIVQNGKAVHPQAE